VGFAQTKQYHSPRSPSDCHRRSRNARPLRLSRNSNGATKSASIWRPGNHSPSDSSVVLIATRSSRPIQAYVAADAFVRPASIISWP
jgi:hypothetical protein